MTALRPARKRRTLAIWWIALSVPFGYAGFATGIAVSVVVGDGGDVASAMLATAFCPAGVLIGIGVAGWVAGRMAERQGSRESPR